MPLFGSRKILQLKAVNRLTGLQHHSTVPRLQARHDREHQYLYLSLPLPLYLYLYLPKPLPLCLALCLYLTLYLYMPLLLALPWRRGAPCLGRSTQEHSTRSRAWAPRGVCTRN